MSNLVEEIKKYLLNPCTFFVLQMMVLVDLNYIIIIPVNLDLVKLDSRIICESHCFAPSLFTRMQGLLGGTTLQKG